MFLIPTSARAEGNVWDIVTSFGDGMKQIRSQFFGELVQLVLY